MALLTMEVAELLVKKCIRELDGLPDKFLPDILERVNPVWIHGRKRDTLDVDKTIANTLRFIERLSIVCSNYYHPEAHHCRSIAVIENKLTMIVFVMPFNDSTHHHKFTLHYQISKMTISRHALARWLYRNDSQDYREGLRVLGEAMFREDMAVGTMAYEHGKFATGESERQIKCDDGGVAIVKMLDPNSLNHSGMDWTVLTYLDPSLIKNWNTEAINSEYKNIEHKFLDDVYF